MNEFKKWWEEEGKDYVDEGGMCYQECAEACWRVALEQVLLWGSDDDVLFNKIKDEIYGG